MSRLGDHLSLGAITLLSCVTAPAVAAQTAVIPPAPSPPPPEALGVRAVPRGTPSIWLSIDDYPAAALRAGEKGLVRIVLTISPAGTVTDCLVATSSGSATLDAESCKLLKRRARFTPAKNHRGEAVEDSWLYRFEWSPPTD